MKSQFAATIFFSLTFGLYGITIAAAESFNDRGSDIGDLTSTSQVPAASQYKKSEVEAIWFNDKNSQSRLPCNCEEILVGPKLVCPPACQN